LGFNLFGEGVRRLIDNVGVRVARLVNKYTVAVALVALLGFGWAQQNTGLIVTTGSKPIPLAGKTPWPMCSN
jgi:hypothetical protein